MGKPPSVKKKNPNAPKAVSIWADRQTRATFKRVSTRADKPLSEIVRVLVSRYDATGKAPGLPKLAPKKSQRKPALAVAG